MKRIAYLLLLLLALPLQSSQAFVRHRVVGGAPAAGSTIIVEDHFVTGSDTDCTAWTPDTTGTGYTEEADTGASSCQVNNGSPDDIVRRAANDNDTYSVYSAQPNPTGNDYDVQITVSGVPTDVGSQERTFFLFGRYTDTSDSGYACVAVIGSSDEWRLVKRVSGTNTTLGTYAAIPAASDTVKLEIRDAAKKCFINDTERISSADNTITATGKAGFGWGSLYDEAGESGEQRGDYNGDDFYVTQY